MVVCVGETDKLPPDEGETDVEFVGGIKSSKIGEYKCPIVVGGTEPACHEICMEAFEVPDHVRFALVPLTMVVLFDESDGIQTGAGVRPKDMFVPVPNALGIFPKEVEPEPDVDVVDVVTFTVFVAVAVFPPPEHVTV